MTSSRSLVFAASILLLGCAEALFGADGAVKPDSANNAVVYTIAVSGTT